jgi:tetratricopeptide (TPR) repeat protein
MTIAYFLLLDRRMRRILRALQNDPGRTAMLATIVFAALAAAQGAPHAVPADSAMVDAAYSELAAGETARAITSLERELAREPRNPALLINLGAAYAREGRYEDARRAYQAAADSRERYSLQLADGSWEDSRTIARAALTALNRGPAVAVN